MNVKVIRLIQTLVSVGGFLLIALLDGWFDALGVYMMLLANNVEYK